MKKKKKNSATMNVSSVSSGDNLWFLTNTFPAIFKRRVRKRTLVGTFLPPSSTRNLRNERYSDIGSHLILSLPLGSSIFSSRSSVFLLHPCKLVFPVPRASIRVLFPTAELRLFTCLHIVHARIKRRRCIPREES